MRTIFEKHKTQNIGMFIIRESSSKPLKNIDFARTVTFKICYIVRTHTYCLCNVLTDGAIMAEYESLEKLLEHLNADEYGYRPLTKEEMLEMLSQTNQGFY